MMYISCVLQADVTILLRTVRAFANKLRLSNPSGTLEQVIAELEITLNDSDSLASEVSAALLRVVKCLIESEVTRLVLPSGPHAMQAFVSREELIDADVSADLCAALQTSASAYVSLSDLESLVAMSRANVCPIAAKLPIIRERREQEASEGEEMQGTREVDMRYIALADGVNAKAGKHGKLKIALSAVGLAEISETSCTEPSCAYRVVTDRITAGSQYHFGQWMMSIFECSRKQLTGLITTGEVVTGHAIDLQLRNEEGRVFTVGRRFNCDVCLPDTGISRVSIEISYTQGSWMLRNCTKIPLWKDFHRKYTIGRCESPAVRIRERIHVRVRNREYTLVPQPLELMQQSNFTSDSPSCITAQTGRESLTLSAIPLINNTR